VHAGGTETGRQDVSVQSVVVSAPVGRVQQQARVVVRRASIEVEVEKVAPAIDQATRLAQAFEGYVENAITLSELTVTLNRRVVLGPLGLIGAGLATLIGKLFVWR
jgi:light-regulated signal transduction histidine kinase (bacteriophytochrome)